MLIGEPGGLIDQQTGGFDFRRHIGELELNGLKFADGLAELLALLGVFHGGVEAPCAMPSASAAMEMRPPSRIFKLPMKPSPSSPRRFSSGNAAIGENDFGSVAGAQAELVFFFAGLEAGSSLFDDERADAVRVLGFVGDRHGHADVGVVAIGGEGFRAVDDPVIAVALGGGASAAGVGAGFGLGERPGADLLALRERREIFLAFALRCRT